MHGNQKIPAIFIKGTGESVDQRFQRGEQQGQRGAQLMTDIGKEATRDFVEFAEFLIVFFKHLLVAIQFEAQGKFAVALSMLEVGADDHNHVHANEKEEIVNRWPGGPGWPMNKARGNISKQTKA